MWPWEHAIVGYLVYSLFCHVAYREPPDGLEAFTVVFVSVLPDLIDKPLAWEFGLFDAGYAVGHSIFVALSLSVVVGIVTRSVGRSRVGLAFALGYLVHLPADVVDAYVREGAFIPELMLWPVASVDAQDPNQGFADYFFQLFGRYQSELLAGDLPAYLWVQLGLGAFTFVLWLLDGAPVLRELLFGCKRLAFELLGAGSPSERSSKRR